MGILNYILKIMKLSAAPGKDKKLEIDVIEKNVSSQNTWNSRSHLNIFIVSKSQFFGKVENSVNVSGALHSQELHFQAISG